MKSLARFWIVLMFVMMSGAGYAQVVSALPDEDETPVRIAEEAPEFPGGKDSLDAFVRRELVYPPIAMENNIQGVVLVEFVVEKDGRVAHGKVLASLFTDCDVEALRVIMSMPTWKPAKNQGNPVRCYYMCPIRFRL